MGKEKLLSVSEFALEAKKAQQTIYSMILSGELKSEKIQVRNRVVNKIPASELTKFKT